MIECRDWAGVVREAAEDALGNISKENRPQWQIDNKEAIQMLVQAKAEAFKHGTR